MTHRTIPCSRYCLFLPYRISVCQTDVIFKTIWVADNKHSLLQLSAWCQEPDFASRIQDAGVLTSVQESLSVLKPESNLDELCSGINVAAYAVAGGIKFTNHVLSKLSCTICVASTAAKSALQTFQNAANPLATAAFDATAKAQLISASTIFASVQLQALDLRPSSQNSIEDDFQLAGHCLKIAAIVCSCLQFLPELEEASASNSLQELSEALSTAKDLALQLVPFVLDIFSPEFWSELENASPGVVAAAGNTIHDMLQILLPSLEDSTISRQISSLLWKLAAKASGHVVLEQMQAIPLLSGSRLIKAALMHISHNANLLATTTSSQDSQATMTYCKLCRFYCSCLLQVLKSSTMCLESQDVRQALIDAFSTLRVMIKPFNLPGAPPESVLWLYQDVLPVMHRCLQSFLTSHHASPGSRWKLLSHLVDASAGTPVGASDFNFIHAKFLLFLGCASSLSTSPNIDNSQNANTLVPAILSAFGQVWPASVVQQLLLTQSSGIFGAQTSFPDKTASQTLFVPLFHRSYITACSLVARTSPSCMPMLISQLLGALTQGTLATKLLAGRVIGFTLRIIDGRSRILYVKQLWELTVQLRVHSNAVFSPQQSDVASVIAEVVTMDDPHMQRWLVQQLQPNVCLGSLASMSASAAVVKHLKTVPGAAINLMTGDLFDAILQRLEEVIARQSVPISMVCCSIRLLCGILGISVCETKIASEKCQQLYCLSRSISAASFMQDHKIRGIISPEVLLLQSQLLKGGFLNSPQCIQVLDLAVSLAGRAEPEDCFSAIAAACVISSAGKLFVEQINQISVFASVQKVLQLLLENPSTSVQFAAMEAFKFYAQNTAHAESIQQIIPDAFQQQLVDFVSGHCDLVKPMIETGHVGQFTHSFLLDCRSENDLPMFMRDGYSDEALVSPSTDWETLTLQLEEACNNVEAFAIRAPPATSFTQRLKKVAHRIEQLTQ